MQSITYVQNNNSKSERLQKVKNYCYFTEKYIKVAHCIFNLRHAVPKETSIILHNRLNHVFYLMVKCLLGILKGMNVAVEMIKQIKYTSFFTKVKKKLSEKKYKRIQQTNKDIESYMK